MENERNGRFVAMPSRRLRQEKRAYRDLCHPLNQETRELLTKEIFEAYDALEEKKNSNYLKFALSYLERTFLWF